MENRHDPNMNKSEDLPNLKKVIEQKKKESQIPSDMKKMLSELDGDSKVENVVSNLFYKSVKNIFDFGFELAEKLNLELLSSFKLDKEKEKKEE